MTPDLPASAPVTFPKYMVKAGVVVSRPPLITPDLLPFEKAYYLYQRRLNERLVLPFTQYFYYKRNTPAFLEWRKRKDERLGTPTRDIGEYNPYKDDGWNDEVLIGDNSADPERVVENLVQEEGRAEDFVGESGRVNTAGLRRSTAADEKNDQRSLERSLSRTLYLLVKEKNAFRDYESWVFPSGTLTSKDGLKEAAQRALDETCGQNLNTWFVGSHPVGHSVWKYRLGTTANEKLNETDTTSETSPETQVQTAHDAAEYVGDKTFFMKARVFAGQANVTDANGSYEDFKWLSKEEIKKHCKASYWSSIKDMLVAQ